MARGLGCARASRQRALSVAAPPATAADVQRRTVANLVASQALGGVGVSTGIAVIVLLAEDILGSAGLAGLPQSAQVFGSAAGAYGIAALSQRAGRRIGLAAGYATGASGAVLCVLAAVVSSFALLMIGAALLGCATAANSQARFAATAAKHGAAPLVQIDPTGVSLAAIASGRYDAYLHSYASAVKAFGRQVVLSFAPEANAPWYTWGYRHTPAAVYVAAWRHVVNVFRAAGTRNVTWLWTVNTIQCGCHIRPPASWWPGSSYVNWVGIDGYYYQPSWKFAALFGPTIKNIRTVTLDPILISETAAPAASQPAKIADLFAGIRAYGLLGFVWFNRNKEKAWRIAGPAAIAALRRGAEKLKTSAHDR